MKMMMRVKKRSQKKKLIEIQRDYPLQDQKAEVVRMEVIGHRVKQDKKLQGNQRDHKEGGKKKG